MNITVINYRYVLFIIWFSFSTNCLIAQSLQTSKITWTCSQFRDLITNELVSSTCRFVSSNNQSLQWVQKGGNLVYDFEVLQVTGSWADVSGPGSISYNVRLGSSTGSVTISRIDGNVKVMVHLDGESGQIKNEYVVSNVEITPQ